jgi:DNA polymerase elongation subunit (family B)
MPGNYTNVATSSRKCYILSMNTHLYKPLDDSEDALALDIEVAVNGRFPEPKRHYAGEFVCMTVYLSSKNEFITYGTHDITSDTRASIAAKCGKFVLCKDEKEMVQRALWMIETAKPTYAFGDDTEPALMALYARANELGVVKPNFDKMFRKYDSQYAAYCV